MVTGPEVVVLLAYEWLREWQTLIAAAAVLFVLRIYCRLVLRSLRVIAQALDRSLQQQSFVELQNQNGRSGQQRPASLARGLHDLSAHPPSPADILARLEALRNTVRSALAEIPAGSSQVPEDGIKLYQKIASTRLDDIDAESQWDAASATSFHELQGLLTDLRVKPSDKVDGKSVWEALVRVNRLARTLQEATRVEQTPDRVWGTTAD
jgi:hypothetical protein